MTFKKFGKAILSRQLERQVEHLRRKNDFKLIAVGGSVGKTSTKLAIAKTLSATQRVRYQDGNYNDRLTVPLVFFDETEPGIFNIIAWARILLRNRQKLKQVYPYDMVVVEIGTDGPGQMQEFAYLQPDISIVTAVAEEHMEYFHDLDTVASEELTPVSFSKRTLINLDDVPLRYLSEQDYLSYGLQPGSNYQITERQPRGSMGQQVDIKLAGKKPFQVNVSPLGVQGAKLVLAAAAVADILGFDKPQIVKGLQGITPVAGRMQVLAGKQNSTLIDDTYNASPLAVKAALDVLYATPAKQRIAILGSMNEMGAGSEAMHQEIGEYCNPKLVDQVITIGQAANNSLAPAAVAQGCSVKAFLNPYEAGTYAATQLQPGAVVLAKGSQNGVFAEEALKQLLARPADEKKLVRQSSYWLKRKRAQFSR